MTDFTVCNICEHPGTIEHARDVGQVHSNVRKFKNEKFTVWRCTNCGSLHCKESVDLAHYYAHYPLQHDTLNYVNYIAYRNRLRLLKKHGLDKRHKILDFGCGSGVFVAFLRRQGYDASGYDAFVETYKDRKTLTTRYDVITSYDVIEHFDDPKVFLEQLVSCLKPDGLLAIGTPNADDIRLSDPYKPEFHQPYHRHILSQRGLLNLAAQKNLHPVMINHRWYFDTMFPMVNARFIESLMRCNGNVIDAAGDKPAISLFLSNPQLLFFGFAGYFFPPKGNMQLFFRFHQ